MVKKLKVSTWFNKNKIIIRNVIIVIVSLIALYWIIFALTPKQTIPVELKNKIDSLSQANIQLEKNQKRLDSTITLYQNDIENINKKIGLIKQTKIIINKQYHEKIDSVSNYTPSELDGFFSNRYK